MTHDAPKPAAQRELAEEVIDALIRLAKADFSVRLARNYKRDTQDVMAMFVNLIAEELDRLMTDRELQRAHLESGVLQLSEAFLSLAAGDFAVRAPRTESGDPLDVLGFLFNNTADEVGGAFGEIDRQRLVLEAILESMIDGVLLLDAAGKVQRANAALARVLGFDAASLVDRSFEELVLPRDRDFARALAAAVDDGAFRDRDVLFRASHGGSISMAVNGSAQRDVNGALSGIVLVTRDDRQLKQAHAQLQLADRLATMGTMAAGVAHEINNPLSYLMSNLDFVAEELTMGSALDDLEEIRKALRASQAGAERVRIIVRDLKAFSRVDQDAVALVDLRKLLDASSRIIRNEIRHHARLVTDYEPLPAVHANEARLVQVFLNLIQNAAHAIPAGNVEKNEIRLVTGTTADGLPFAEVRDTGAGIAEENRARIFDAFFTTKAIGVGTGLGLSICHKIVTAMGGTIEVESVVGVGTTFRVVLPAASVRASDVPPPEAASERYASTGGRKHVLVIDDEAEVGPAIERLLGEHQVVSVTGGVAALALLATRTFDVILCDLMMPEMTGMEFFDRLAADQPDVARRVVFMTGGPFGSGIHEFLARVPNARIEKPFVRDELRRIVLEQERAP